MCTASDMRIYNVDIKLKTRYNMPDNKQGWNITLEYLMFCAGVAQWQSVGFPSRSRGFDSHHPLHFFNTARLLIAVEFYFAVNEKKKQNKHQYQYRCNGKYGCKTCSGCMFCSFVAAVFICRRLVEVFICANCIFKI